MKKLNIILIGLLSFSFLTTQTATAGTKARVKTDRMEYSQGAAPSTSSYSSGSFMNTNRDGIGFSTGQVVTFGFSSLTGFFEVGPKGSVQVFFTIPTTAPFSIAVGGLYKHTVLEGQGGGLHLGGGFGFGSINLGTGANFGVDIAGIAGFHFGVPGAPRIQVNLDGGVSLQIINNSTNFAMAPLSPALGASVIYFFN